MSAGLREAIIGELDTLNDEQLRRVFGSVRAVKAGAADTVGDLVREFGGSIPADELDRMERAIEEDCERIEPDPW